MGLIRASASTTGRPRVRLGTKWASITSTWAQSALPIRLSSRSRFAKSLARMLGEICTAKTLGALVRKLAQQGEEHRIGALHMRPQLDERPFPEMFDGLAGAVTEQLAGVDDLDLAVLLGDIRDHEPGLGKVGAARRVADDPTRLGRLNRRYQQRPLTAAGLDQIRGRAAPAGFWPAPQRPETGALCVDQNPVVGLRLVLADLTAVTCADHDLDAGLEGRIQGLANQVSPVLTDLVGIQCRPALRPQSGQERGLAPGTGAQIQPFLVLRASAGGGTCHGEGDQLRPLVLD